jgi:hypothetical protein
MARFCFRVRVGERRELFSLVTSLARDSEWQDRGWRRVNRSPLYDRRLTAVQARLEPEPGAGWTLVLQFDQLIEFHVRHRPDLDSALELTEPGRRTEVTVIEVSSPLSPFGWLHPAAPIPFVIGQQCWKTAAEKDWPLDIRKALRVHRSPDRLKHQVLLAAMRARFQQHHNWARRLRQVAYPVICSDCPTHIYEELSRTVSSAGDLTLC